MKKFQAISLVAALSAVSFAAHAAGFSTPAAPTVAAIGVGAASLTSSSNSSANNGGFSASLTAPGHIDANVTQGNQSFSNASLTYGATNAVQSGYSNTYGQTGTNLGQTGTTNTFEQSATAGFTTATQSGSENFDTAVINTAFTPSNSFGNSFGGDSHSSSTGGSFTTGSTSNGNASANADGGAGLLGGSFSSGLHW